MLKFVDKNVFFTLLLFMFRSTVGSDFKLVYTISYCVHMYSPVSAVRKTQTNAINVPLSFGTITSLHNIAEFKTKIIV